MCKTGRSYVLWGILLITASMLGCGQENPQNALGGKQAEETAGAAKDAVVAEKAPEAAGVAEEEETGERLVVSDFNDGKRLCNIGGEFGCWNRDPNDPTQNCHESFDATTKLNGDSGYSLRLDYDVDSPNPAYNGFWLKLNGLNLTGYKKLVFYIKGDPMMGYSEKVKIELKNATQAGKFTVAGIGDSWTKVAVPLSEFGEITDWSSMSEFVIVFDDMTVTKRTGTINIDNIYFVK